MPPALLSVPDAQARMFALAVPVASETVPLAQAVGRWATEDVSALRTQPHADLSAMDGYAIRYADLPGPFALIGESAAGHGFAASVNAGDTVRIFTGAALPPGADTVLVQEEARREGDTIHLMGEGPTRHGGNVRRRGLDFTAGNLLIARGQRITPAALALAAIGGHATLRVARRPTVAIAATGDELAPPGTDDPTKLPETNGLMLAAMLRDLPVDIIDLGILPDDLSVMTAAFAAVRADILVTTGGASVGDHDLVRPALEAAGGSIDFWRIALRPGKPMMAGRLGETVVLGLPGNPVSAFVTATIFLLPMIAAMSGAENPLPVPLPARLGDALPANDHRQDFLRATLRNGHVFTSSVQDSSMLRTLARANCLLIRSPYAPAAEIGDTAEILPLA
jgi:molybdopterin molybdotransferase